MAWDDDLGLTEKGQAVRKIKIQRTKNLVCKNCKQPIVRRESVIVYTHTLANGRFSTHCDPVHSRKEYGLAAEPLEDALHRFWNMSGRYRWVWAAVIVAIFVQLGAILYLHLA